ncbi:lanthionine synthetase C family protein [Paenibacillus sp. FSL M8-0228]|uniref:lanthionine synthetase C family protein n=1 Tax=Paenibacillus TaxID=44249 RepID=UPI00083E0B5E|nr:MULTISPECIES: lanthionine synthetase C family protein [Paenibacillus]MBO3285357.1 lanthionine synthetase C family protein [Paenibacillus polymyxa]MBP1308119.1 lantibiotic modifying enzyme [Paenibacillus sp. 1182]ODB57148.1 lantibiotic modifying enzyme [Paenibacillus polymyxa]
MITTGISEDLRQTILEIVHEVGRRLADSDYVTAMCSSDSNRTDLQLDYKWDEISLASGYPAVSLLYGRLGTVFREETFTRYAHQYLVNTREALKLKENISLSLWSGLSGIGFTAYALSDNLRKYRSFIEQINHLILRYGAALLESSRNNLKAGVIFHDYDVISGWSGIGRYLLLFKDVPEMRDLLKDVLEYLVMLSEERAWNGEVLPGWYIPVHNLPPHEQQRYPEGYFNMGLAHGIPGPLALLSIAWHHDVRVSGHKKAIERFGSWLSHWKQQNDFGWYWPNNISYREYMNGIIFDETEREAWCYGTPGVARSLWLAGRALENEKLEALAVDAFKSIYARPRERWSIYSPSVCHGYSGLIKLTHQMYLDTGDAELRDYAQGLLLEVVNMFDRGAAFGFWDIVKDTQSVKHLDFVGVLDGVAGIVMTLLDTLESEESIWGRSLLIT